MVREIDREEKNIRIVHVNLGKKKKKKKFGREGWAVRNCNRRGVVVAAAAR